MNKTQVFSIFTLFFTAITFSDHSANYEDVQKILSQFKQPIHFVNFSFSDIHGNLKEVIQPISYLKKSLENSIPFDGSSICGLTAINKSDLLLKPDMRTLSLAPSYLPNQYGTSIRFICDVFDDEETPCQNSPRYVLQKVMAQAEEMGYAFYVGPELEFFLFNQQSNKKTVYDTSNYFDTDETIQLQSLKRTILALLQGQNINVEKLHHEVAPGQFELSIRYDNALKIADQIILTKQTIKTIAKAKGLHATFMPKPLFGKNGSAMHLHFSLFDIKNQCNAFYDQQGSHYLSLTAKQFIAGILNHAKELTAIFNPTVNSYKRLVRGYEAPVNICWSLKNRSSLVRIPYFNPDHPNSARAEIRSPDPLANPYLALAALLLAGLTGIKNNEQLSKEIRADLYQLDEAALKNYNIQSLPASLSEALDLFQLSPLAHELLGKELRETFINLKQQELNTFKRVVTDWEWKQYA